MRLAASRRVLPIVRILLVSRTARRAGADSAPMIDGNQISTKRTIPRFAAGSRVANTAGSTDFPIQNLPFGVFQAAGSDERAHRWAWPSAIRFSIFALGRSSACSTICRGAARRCLATESLNPLMALRPCGGVAGCGSDVSRMLGADSAGADPARARSDERCAARAAGLHWRLHRLLRVHLPRDQRRAACSAPTIRCCRITSMCRSPITAAARRS